MFIEVLKSKIHRVKITQAELHYVGSITIDEDLMDAANMIENEKVQVVNVNNGERLRNVHHQRRAWFWTNLSKRAGRSQSSSWRYGDYHFLLFSRIFRSKKTPTSLDFSFRRQPTFIKNMVKTAVSVLKYSFSLLLAVALLYFAFRNVDFVEFMAKAKTVDYSWVRYIYWSCH